MSVSLLNLLSTLLINTCRLSTPLRIISFYWFNKSSEKLNPCYIPLSIFMYLLKSFSIHMEAIYSQYRLQNNWTSFLCRSSFVNISCYTVFYYFYIQQIPTINFKDIRLSSGDCSQPSSFIAPTQSLNMKIYKVLDFLYFLH